MKRYITNSGAIKPRFSNEDGLANASSGSGIFDWNKIDWNKGLDSVTDLISNIWGNSDKYQAQALQQINKQQSTTMTILWVVIGLMVALGVVLLIRKTK